MANQLEEGRDRVLGVLRGGGQTNTVHATATGREITANPGCDPTGATRVSASITRWWSLFILLLEEEALCCE